MKNFPEFLGKKADVLATRNICRTFTPSVFPRCTKERNLQTSQVTELHPSNQISLYSNPYLLSGHTTLQSNLEE